MYRISTCAFNTLIANFPNIFELRSLQKSLWHRYSLWLRSYEMLRDPNWIKYRCSRFRSLYGISSVILINNSLCKTLVMAGRTEQNFVTKAGTNERRIREEGRACETNSSDAWKLGLGRKAAGARRKGGVRGRKMNLSIWNRSNELVTAEEVD